MLVTIYPYNGNLIKFRNSNPMYGPLGSRGHGMYVLETRLGILYSESGTVISVMIEASTVGAWHLRRGCSYLVLPCRFLGPSDAEAMARLLRCAKNFVRHCGEITSSRAGTACRKHQ